MMRPVLAACLFAAIAGPASAGDLVDDDRGPVHLKTDLGEADRDAVHALVAETRERVARILESLGVKRKSKGLTRLRVYATREGYEERRRKTTPVEMHWATAFFDQSNNEVVTWWAGGSRTGRETLRHEVTHQILGEYGKNLPIWFDEGFASYVGAIEVDEFGDPLTLVDAQKIQRMRSAFRSGRYAPLYELMDMKWIEFFGKEGTKKLNWDRPTMYAESWSLVFYLLHAAYEQDVELREMVAKRIDTGRWSQAKFKRMLPELEPRWRAFIDRDDMIRADQHTMAAHKASVQGAWEQAAKEAEAALQADPDRRAAARILARAALHTGREVEAVEMLEKLLEAGESEAIWMDLAAAHLSLARKTKDEATRKQAARDGRDAALRAAELAAHQRAHHALVLAADCCEAMGDAKEALRCVREALKQKAIPAELRSDLRQREEALVKRVIAGG